MDLHKKATKTLNKGNRVSEPEIAKARRERVIVAKIE